MNVILRSKVGAITLSTNFGEKPVKFDFNEKNGFECEVPTEVTIKDAWEKMHLVHQNYAQNILNNCRDEGGNPIFEIVEVKETPAVVPPVEKKKKEKANETVLR